MPFQKTCILKLVLAIRTAIVFNLAQRRVFDMANRKLTIYRDDERLKKSQTADYKYFIRWYIIGNYVNNHNIKI